MRTSNRRELVYACVTLSIGVLLLIMIVSNQSKVKIARASPTTTCATNSYWCTSNSGSYGVADGFKGVAVISSTNVYAVGSYEPQDNQPFIAFGEYWTGQAWYPISSQPVSTHGSEFNAVAASFATNVITNIFAVGGYYDASGYEHALAENYDVRYGFQNAFATEPSVALESRLTSVTAVPNSNEFWAAGYYNDRNDGYYKAFVEHWDGLHWGQPTTFNIPRTSELWGVTAINSGNVWAVGYSADGSNGNNYPLILHYMNGTWSVVPGAQPTNFSGLYSIDWYGAGDIWAAGNYVSGTQQSALVEHWSSADGITGTWSVVPTNPSWSLLNSIWVTEASDVWATGGPTGIIHWNGSYWDAIDTPNLNANSELLGIGASVTSTWAVGDYTDPQSGNSRTLAEALLPPSAPAHTTSYYEETTSTMSHYYQGCHAAYTQQQGVVVLDYGEPENWGNVGIRRGTKLIGSGRTAYITGTIGDTYPSIEAAVESYTMGYHDAIHNPNSMCPTAPPVSAASLTVAVGVNNCTGDQNSAIWDPNHALAWSTMVSDVIRYSMNYTEVRISAALDAEPPAAGSACSWSNYPPVATWATSYSNQNVSYYYNFGSTDAYPYPPPPGPGTPTPVVPPPPDLGQSDWDTSQFYTLAWGLRNAYPLPEAYHPWLNREWYIVDRWGYDNHGATMGFKGSMTDCPTGQICFISSEHTPELTTDQGYQSLWMELNADPFTGTDVTLPWSTTIVYTK